MERTEADVKRRKRMRFGIQIVALLILFLVIVTIVDIGEVADSLQAFTPLVIAVGFALALLRAFLLSVRWRILDTAGRAEREARLGRPETRISQMQYFRYRLANSTFNLFMPTAVGADVARAALLASEVADDRTRRVLVILFDRIIGILSISLLGLFAGIVAPELAHREKYLATILLLNVVLVGVLAVGFSSAARRLAITLLNKLGRFGRKLVGTVESIGECFETFRHHKNRVWAALALCLAIHTTSFVLVWLAASALEVDLSFATLAIVTTISWVVVLVPVTIGGLGLREVAFVVLMTPQGVAEADATAVSLFQFAMIVLVGLAGIPVTVFGGKKRASDP